MSSEQAQQPGATEDLQAGVIRAIFSARPHGLRSTKPNHRKRLKAQPAPAKASRAESTSSKR